MKDSLAVALAGAGGRMGNEVLQAISTCTDIHLTQALVSAHNTKNVGKQLGHACFGDLCYTTQLEKSADAEVLIVFSLPHAGMEYLRQAREIGLATLMCPTGFTAEQIEQCNQVAKDIPLMMAPNTSIGVVWLAKLAAALARGLPDADIEILETHHNQKVDAPSGTAVRLGRCVAAARNTSLEKAAEYQRNRSGDKRTSGSIGFSTLRLGGVVGEHSVLFGLEGETIELHHRSISRQTFALGALTLARWLAAKPAGMYTVEHAIEKA